MRLTALKIAFILASLATSVIIVPSSFSILQPRSRESFSELYLLGTDHSAENFPFNIKSNETYRIFLEVRNHIGSSAYYAIYVKLRNQSEPSPSPKVGSPSSLPTLHSYYVSLPDDGYWEVPLYFHFRGLRLSGDSCVVEDLVINDVVFDINKKVLWDSEKKGFYLQLFFELWINDSESGEFRFHNRFVGIWLNITA